MKEITLLFCFLIIGGAFAQPPLKNMSGEVVFENSEVIFYKIDDQTWVGIGNLMSNESMYLIEGNDKAILLDTGTKIERLDKIVSSISSKPVTLIATHVHPDHTGSGIHDFDEIWINAADVVNVPMFMPDFKGEIRYLSDGQVFDLGGRKIEVVFTPGHTPGSTTFIDKHAKYGFSGDSFGSGNLLLTTTFSTLWTSAKRMDWIFTRYDLTKLYPGHFFGMNYETHQKIKDIVKICEDVLDGRTEGKIKEDAFMGLDRVIEIDGLRINFSESAMK